MGILTDDMTRLRDEIVTLRGARNAFTTDTAHTVSQMRARFREAQADMASKTKAERTAFVAGLQAKVGELEEALRSSHAEMAKELREALAASKAAVTANEAARQGQATDDRAERLAFVVDLNRKVAGMLAEFAADLEGARRGWLGPRRATTTPTETTTTPTETTPRAAGRKGKRARAR